LENNKMANVGIFLFHSFAVNPNLIEAKDLNRSKIMDLLNISAIIKIFGIINKE
jgi:hypothetical protein